MAHEISIRRDGKAEMAFIGDTPWHGLGQSVTKGASIGVWLKEAGMDWEAKEAVPQFHAIGDKLGSLRAVESNKVIYRGDTGAPLSIMGSGYKVVQPRQILEFFRKNIEGGGWHIHTAGVLRGGRKLWAMATTEDPLRCIKGNSDPILNNMLIATSLDGTMPTTAALIKTRVVCANTLAWALGEGGAQVKVSHRSIFDAAEIQRALGIAEESFDAFMEKAREMAETPIDLDQARDVLAQIFKPIKKETIDLSWMGDLSQLGQAIEPEVKDARSSARVLELFQGEGRGSDLKTAKGTRWGLFNAVTEHVDHEMGRTDDTRLDSAWFGRGNGFKQQAFDLLTEEA